MIGKSRPRVHAHRNPPFDPRCGVLGASDNDSVRHARYAADSRLSEWVEYIWIEEWDLRGRPPLPRIMLAQPCIHLVFAHGRSRFYGVQRKRFSRQLQGRDRILGIRFRFGAFYPFCQRPAVAVSDSSMPAMEIFSDADDAERTILSCENDEAMVAAANSFLLGKLPSSDGKAHIAQSVIECIANEPEAARPSLISVRFGLSERALQRLFRQYIGASPRWVISHYRIHEALNQITGARPQSGAQLAADLGYFDQAHFVRDFQRRVGKPPKSYSMQGSRKDEPYEQI